MENANDADFPPNWNFSQYLLQIPAFIPQIHVCNGLWSKHSESGRKIIMELKKQGHGSAKLLVLSDLYISPVYLLTPNTLIPTELN
jgi:hypothetical protein